jgi:hypothetical protein
MPFAGRGPDHYKPDIAVGDHVHMANWWRLREYFPDVHGRVVSISPLRTQAKVACLDGRTLVVHPGNLVHDEERFV